MGVDEVDDVFDVIDAADDGQSNITTSDLTALLGIWGFIGAGKGILRQGLRAALLRSVGDRNLRAFL